MGCSWSQYEENLTDPEWCEHRLALVITLSVLGGLGLLLAIAICICCLPGGAAWSRRRGSRGRSRRGSGRYGGRSSGRRRRKRGRRTYADSETTNTTTTYDLESNARTYVYTPSRPVYNTKEEVIAVPATAARANVTRVRRI